MTGPDNSRPERLDERQAIADISEMYFALAGDGSETIDAIQCMSSERLKHILSVLHCNIMLFDWVKDELVHRKTGKPRMKH